LGGRDLRRRVFGRQTAAIEDHGDGGVFVYDRWRRSKITAIARFLSLSGGGDEDHTKIDLCDDLCQQCRTHEDLGS
jgi:hypothetical protein